MSAPLAIEKPKMTFGSLFAGIGGMDLGLERAGMECRWQVEIKPFPRRVLAKHWPAVKRYEDVRHVYLFDPEGWRFIDVPDPIDVLCGGFPCQDISHAGKGIGIIGERSGLWSEFARLVAELRPSVVFAENVPALRNRGLALVLQDLWSLGYDAEWNCIPASAFGAPHERDRIWIVAYAAGLFGEAVVGREPDGTLSADGIDADAFGERYERDSDADERSPSAGLYRATADADGTRQLQPEGRIGDIGRRSGNSAEIPDSMRSGRAGEGSIGPGETEASGAFGEPVRSTLLRGGEVDADDDGAGCQEQRSAFADGAEQSAPERCDWWAVEPGVVRMVHGVPNRVDRLTGLGNAVVPQVAEWIGRRIIAQAFDPRRKQKTA